MVPCRGCYRAGVSSWSQAHLEDLGKWLTLVRFCEVQNAGQASRGVGEVLGSSAGRGTGSTGVGSEVRAGCLTLGLTRQMETFKLAAREKNPQRAQMRQWQQ